MKTIKLTAGDFSADGLYTGTGLSNWSGHVEIAAPGLEKLRIEGDVKVAGYFILTGPEHGRARQSLRITGSLSIGAALKLGAYLQVDGDLKADEISSSEGVHVEGDLSARRFISVGEGLRAIGEIICTEGLIAARTLVCAGPLLQCAGSLSVEGLRGLVSAEGDIKIGGNVWGDGGFSAGGNAEVAQASMGRVNVRGSLKATGTVNVHEFIRVGGDLTSQGGLFADDGEIVCGGSICGEGAIRAGGKIWARGRISVGGEMRAEEEIFAGEDLNSCGPMTAAAILCEGGSIAARGPGPKDEPRRPSAIRAGVVKGEIGLGAHKKTRRILEAKDLAAREAAWRGWAAETAQKPQKKATAAA